MQENHKNKTVTVQDIEISNTKPFTLIAGPCSIESLEHAMEMAEAMSSITKKLGINFIYKSSFDKANRTSSKYNRGVGMQRGLSILGQVREKFNCPVITDIHTPEQCQPVSEIVDVLQIPAFLCRQTDLLKAAAMTGKPLNIKKGQFLAPWDMKNVVEKVHGFGNQQVMVCERGVSFGYNALVSDMRSLPIMAAQTGCPVVFDATHSVQQPGGQGASSGGQREFVPVLARAAIAVGVAAVFMEVHENPDEAPSDGPNMLRLKNLSSLLETLCSLDKIAKEKPIDLDYWA